MFPTDLPSIWRWKARFHPKFGTLCTIRRPGSGLPCATVPTDIAHAKARIRRTLLTKLRLRFTEHIMPGTGFWPEPIDHHRDHSLCTAFSAESLCTGCTNQRQKQMKYAAAWGLSILPNIYKN